MFRRRANLLIQNLHLMLIFCCFSTNTDPLQNYRSNEYSLPHLARLFGTFLLQMSSSNAYFVVPFLIFLASSIACNARPIGVSNLEPTKNSQFSTKNDGNSGVARVLIPSNVDPSLPNKSEAAENSSFVTETTVLQEDKQIMKTKKPVTDSHQESQGPEASPAVQIKPLANVSWKLPKKKRGEKQAGFNLDYAPPKTHPPVHN